MKSKIITTKKQTHMLKEEKTILKNISSLLVQRDDIIAKMDADQ
jgi:hypothetical protein